MKYIRTKDGQIVKHPHPNAQIFTFKYEIEKSADTIEELCDEFVLGKTKYFEHCVTDIPLDFLKECVIAKTPYDLVVYGAIWTDKGLIYVAKMNDKGELELI